MTAGSLRLVVVNPDGSPGEELGSATRNGDTITFAGSDAVKQTFAALSRRAGGDTQAWDRIAADGWSNGYLMLRADRTAPVTTSATRGRARAGYDPQEMRDHHGKWATTPGADLLKTWDELTGLYGDEHDETSFGSNGRVITWETGDISVVLESPGDKFEVFSDLDPDGARELAEYVQKWVDTDLGDYEDVGVSDNGLLDWFALKDGTIVGIDPDGGVRIGVPDENGKLDEVDLGHQAAGELVDALNEQADRADDVLDSK